MPKPIEARAIRLRPMAGQYQIIRLAADAPLPAGLFDQGGFVSLTRTADETSIVCAQDQSIEGQHCSPGWSGFVVEGPLDFGEIGILARLSSALAKAGVSLFALSTFDTDYLFVRTAQAAKARDALAPFMD